jgi:hypothetical protein
VGGGHFLIHNRITRFRAALRDRTNSALPDLVPGDGLWGTGETISAQIGLADDCWVAGWVAALEVLVVGPTRDDPAFGVFFWFQVTDFDRFFGFFSLCHFIFPIYLGLFVVLSQ